MFRARYESSSFEFEAFALTEEKALNVLTKALKMHTRQYKLKSGWYSPEDCCVDEIHLFTPYRDHEPMGVE
jgi:hypothetical protein